jgi:acetyl esterase/lipase
MIGFSAGAMLTMATTLNNRDAPNRLSSAISTAPVSRGCPARRAASLRGARRRRSVVSRQLRLDRKLAQGQSPVEFHYYEQGGHGFGMYPKETTSTGWFDAFVKWLGMHGYLRPKT